VDAREEIVGRIRTAIGRKLGQKPAPPPEPLLNVNYRGMLDRLRLFQSALEALDGKVYEASSGTEARRIVETILEHRSAVCSNHFFLEKCGITGIANVTSGLTDSAELRNVCAKADVGITSAYCLLAETGTIVLRATPQEPRMISLLPPVHIAVVPRDRLLTNLDEMLSLLPRPVDSSSATVFITGPSRTGDIEQTLVKGVHGPASVHVVIVQGKDTEE
jgi:L-lactate dehydrogenase complex protein LldG